MMKKKKKTDRKFFSGTSYARHRNEEILFSESFAECKMKIRIKLSISLTSRIIAQYRWWAKEYRKKGATKTAHTLCPINVLRFRIAVDKSEMNFNPCFSFWQIDFEWYKQFGGYTIWNGDFHCALKRIEVEERHSLSS